MALLKYDRLSFLHVVIICSIMGPLYIHKSQMISKLAFDLLVSNKEITRAL